MTNPVSNPDFLLTIDPTNTDYQFIHIDIKEQYGIACKFVFDPKDDNKFLISHIKNITYNRSIGGTLSYEVKISSKTKRVSKTDYEYQINIDLTKKIGNSDSDFETGEFTNTHITQQKFDHICKRKNGNTAPSKDFKIDTHINIKPFSFKEFTESFNKETLAHDEKFAALITYGTEFCRFIIQ